MPYVWLPTINTALVFSHPRFSLSSGVPVVLPGETVIGVKTTPSAYLSKLNSAAALTVEAVNGDSSIFADVLYANVGSQAAEVVELSGPLGRLTLPINVQTTLRTTSTLTTGGIGRVFARSPASEFTGFVGVRYIHLTASATWALTGPLGLFPASGSADEAKSDLAAIGGARGRIDFGHNYYIPLYADYGGSGDLTTYQWLAGIGHDSPYNAAVLGWRQLGYFANNNSRVFLESLHLGGPDLTYTFKL